MCLKSTNFNQNKGSFQVEASKVSKFCMLAIFLHGGSDKQPVFIVVGQTSDFFPLLSLLSYTVNVKIRQKTTQGLLFNMFNEWASLLLALYTWLSTTCLNFLAFYQIHHGCGEWDPHLMKASLQSHKDAQKFCVCCRVLGTNQSTLCYVQVSFLKTL